MKKTGTYSFDWLAECEQKTLDKLRQEFPQFYG